MTHPQRSFCRNTTIVYIYKTVIYTNYNLGPSCSAVSIRFLTCSALGTDVSHSLRELFLFKNK